MNIQIGNKTIGKGFPCFIAAEVGINHNGDMNLAFKMIDAAVTAGADAVKFQNYFTEDFLSDHTLKYEYLSQGKQISESQFEMFKRCELNFEQLKDLKTYCDKKGVIFFSTPTSKKGIENLIKIQTPIIKNGSDFLVNLQLIKEMAISKIPTIISTGMATIGEIDDAVNCFKENGGSELIILHCISSYPTPPKEVNLRKIKSLANAFDYPIGFSDHTDGVIAAVGSITMGACFIEKHFTTDKNLPGPDHKFSADEVELKQLVRSVREMEKMMGTNAIGPTEIEIEGRMNFRLSCVAATDLPKGHLLTNNDIAFRRPGNGLPPKAIDWIIGRRLREDILIGNLFKQTDFI